MSLDEPQSIRARLRAAVTAAMKSRDQIAVAVLRSTIGAIDNAEAVDASHGPDDEDEHTRDVIGGVSGLGAGEVMRRHLTEAEIVGIVSAEIEERRTHAGEFRQLGEATHADRLESEATILERFISDA